MRILITTMALWMATGCDYTAPLDPNAKTGANAISGTVVINGTRDIGPVFILIYDANNPPPPVGTGRPVSFGAVPAERFNTDGNGLLAADYAIPDLPDGDYLVSALMDVDNDFHPLIANGSLAGATCGDWLGAYVTDVFEQELAVVSLSGGELQDDITVAIASEVSLERPAFTIPTGQTALNRTLAGSNPETPQVFQLGSTPVFSDAGLELTGPFDGTNPCDTAFAIIVRDVDLDGAPDPLPDPTLAALGAFDIWPRIYMQYVGTPDATGALVNELDEGEAYLGQGLVFPTVLTEPDLVLNAPMLTTTLDVLWIPGAIHQLPSGGQTTVTNPLVLPAGGWGVSLVSLTGQTWTVPNPLASYESTDVAFEPLSQYTVVLME